VVNVFGGSGNDALTGDAGDNGFVGGAGLDTLYGGDGNDWFASLGLNDENDIADGGAGHDYFVASWQADPTITTGTGSDTIELRGGSDGHKVTVTDFTAGSGGDVLDIHSVLAQSEWDGSTNPFVAGFLRLVQNGADTDLQWDRNGTNGGAEWITVVTLQNVNAVSLTSANFFPPIGTPGDDVLTGTDADDTIHALGGSDSVDAGRGNDVVYGGDGNDRLTGGWGSDTLYGENGNDWLNILGLNDDNDIADGGAGDDTFVVSGEVADPTITTGTGSDTIELRGGSDGHKVTVTDFTAGSGGDVLDIRSVLAHSVWDGSTNPFAAGFLRLVQNGADTDLQWDRNGTNDGAEWITVVTLQNVNAVSLTSANFVPLLAPAEVDEPPTDITVVGGGSLAANELAANGTLVGTRG
jgi:Ca2+-binding RTX toxin-like protein